METSMETSCGPRRINPRRNPTEEEKVFKCVCGKSYISKESLYTHRKTKHPEEFALFLQQKRQSTSKEVDDKPQTCCGVDETCKKVLVNSDTFNLLTRSAFLNFFKEMKQMADEHKEILKLFHSEKQGYTKLNAVFLNSGQQDMLTHLIQAQNATTIHHTSSSTQHNSTIASNCMNINLLVSSAVPLFLPTSVEDQPTDHTMSLNVDQLCQEEKSPEYYKNFFIIAREIVKPMSEKFAMELCYLFDKLIEISPLQIDELRQDYQMKNQLILQQLILSKPNQLPKFNAMKTSNRDCFIEKFLFNLSHLFN